MTTTVLIVIVAVVTILVALLLQSIALPSLRVWPLPDNQGCALRARQIVNRVSGIAIGVLSAGVVLLAVLDRHSLPADFRGLTIFGAVIAFGGGTLGICGYLTLGPGRSSDERGPLVSSGPYRFSRNPQYVGAAALLVGFSVALASSQALLAAAVCSLWFLLAPLAEERWLREQLGRELDAYIESAPRYLGWRSRRTRAV